MGNALCKSSTFHSFRFARWAMAFATLLAIGCSRLPTDVGMCTASDSGANEIVEHCSKILEQSKTSDSVRTSALIKRGWAYEEGERNQLALEDFDAALRLGPSSLPALSGRASALHQLGQIYDAAQTMNEILNLAPLDAQYHFERGTFLFTLGRMQNALADFNESIRLNPDYPPAYQWRGAVELSSQRYSEARQDFLYVSVLEPSDAEVLILGYIAARRSGDVRAVEKLRSSLTTLGKSEWPKPAAEMMAGKTSPIEFKESLSNAADWNSIHHLCDSYFYLNVNYRFAGNLDLAAKYLEQATAICPANYPITALVQSEKQ